MILESNRPLSGCLDLQRKSLKNKKNKKKYLTICNLFFFFLFSKTNVFKFLQHTLKDCGETVTPACPLKSGTVAPGGTVNLNVCKIVEKNRKSSALARTSPRQTRRPTPNGMKYSGLITWLLSLLRKRSGLNTSGSFHRDGLM